MKHHLYMRFVMLSLLLGTALSVAAQQKTRNDDAASAQCMLQFRQSSVKLDPDFADNSRHLAALVSELREAVADKSRPLISIDFIGSSSPEGDTKQNDRYAEARISSVESYLRERVSMPDSLITYSTIGANWAMLADSVRCSDIEEKQQVLDIITNFPELLYDNSGRLVDSRRKQLMDMSGGRVWHYMEERWFDAMRCVYVRVVRGKPRVVTESKAADMSWCKWKPEIPDYIFNPTVEQSVVIEQPIVIEQPVDTVVDPVLNHAPVVAPVQTADNAAPEQADKPFYMSVQTNMLYDALLLPTLGAEFYLGRGWSIAGNWTYGWWDPGDRETYWRGYGGYLAVRKYFGKAAGNKPLTGHHVGIYGQILTYDIAYQGKGRMGGEPDKSIFYNPSYGGGVEYGYALPVSSRLNIDFTLGIGYFGGKYYSYKPVNGHYEWKGTNHLHWFGPTNLQISLVWLIGRGNTNARQ